MSQNIRNLMSHNSSSSFLEEDHRLLETNAFSSSNKYRMIYTMRTYCWQTSNSKNNYFLYSEANGCKGTDNQLFYYEHKHGQIKSKKWGDEYCLTNDLDKIHYKEYLYFAKCHYGSNQAWNYWDLHWSSHYDGKCIDRYRPDGRYHMKTCRDTDDQKHHPFDYRKKKYEWFDYSS